MAAKKDTATALELFAGCGGFSVGLRAAGYRVVGGFDHYPRCVWTYEHNHAEDGSKAILCDLRDPAHVDTKPKRGRRPIGGPPATGEGLLAALGLSKPVDLVCGGPPCQSFSIRGKMLALEDSRGTLVFDFARLVGEIGPKAFIFENVANLASSTMAPVLGELLKRFAKLGYRTTHGVLLAADYGVAQNRKRLFIVGSRDRELSLPPATHSNRPEAGLFRHVTVSDVLDDIPDVETPGAEAFANHAPTRHTKQMLAAFARLLPGKRDPKSHHDRLHPDRPGFTLRAGVGNFSPLRPIHYRYDRVVSVRESARLQGFPDDFVWPERVPRLQQYRQVGNAVPPPLGAAVAAHVGQQLGFRLRPDPRVVFPGRDTWKRWDAAIPVDSIERQLSFLPTD